MCLSGEIPEKFSVLIEFIIFFVLQGLDIGNHCGILITVLNQNSKCKELISTSEYLQCSGGGNGTSASLAPDQEHLNVLSLLMISFLSIGALLFIVHIAALLPNVIQYFRHEDMLSYKESAHVYYRSVLKIHSLLLILETLIFDIPIGSIVMDIIAQLWKRPNNFNCWDCIKLVPGLANATAIVNATADGSLPALPGIPDLSLDVSQDFVTLSLVGISFISLYKGMMPLFVWIGNPFCFPCVPLRLLVVLPGGLIALVMTMGPIMGVAKEVLIPHSPPEMLNIIGGISSTFFQIGMIFWGLFGIGLIVGGACWWQFCRDEKEGGGCCCC